MGRASKAVTTGALNIIVLKKKKNATHCIFNHDFIHYLLLPSKHISVIKVSLGK